MSRPAAFRVLRGVLKMAPGVLLLLVLAFAAIAVPSVMRPRNLEGIAIAAAPIAILALGAMVVLITAGIDLSAGFGVAMIAVFLSGAMQGGAGFGEGIALAAGCGIALGIVNGLLVSVIHLEPFIATLATYVAVPGVTLMAAGSGEVVLENNTILAIGNGSIAHIPIAILIAVACAIIVGWLLNATSVGAHLFALGSRSADTARLAGVSVRSHLLLVYVISGILTACTAVVLAAQSVVVAPNIGGVSVLLDAFAATVLGGTSIYGARGSVSGTVAGALIIALITNVLQVSGASAESLQLWDGVIIGAALALDALLERARRRLQSREPAAVLHTSTGDMVTAA